MVGSPKICCQITITNLENSHWYWELAGQHILESDVAHCTYHEDSRELLLTPDQALGKITYKFYFIFVAFNILVTFPTIWLTFKETKKLTLEEIDLLFGERAADAAPGHLEVLDQKHASEMVEESDVVASGEAKI